MNPTDDEVIDRIYRSGSDWGGASRRVTVSLPSDAATIDQHIADALQRKVEMSGTAETLISTRESTHGDYPTMAKIQINLVQAMENSPNWVKLHPGVKVGLMSSAMKMARILTGDWTTADHYDDIEGYIRLAGKVAAVCRAEGAGSEADLQRAVLERSAEAQLTLRRAEEERQAKAVQEAFQKTLREAVKPGGVLSTVSVPMLDPSRITVGDCGHNNSAIGTAGAGMPGAAPGIVSGYRGGPVGLAGKRDAGTTMTRNPTD